MTHSQLAFHLLIICWQACVIDKRYKDIQNINNSYILQNFKAVFTDLFWEMGQALFNSLWFLWDTTAHWSELFYKMWTQKLWQQWKSEIPFEPIKLRNMQLRWTYSKFC